LEYRFAHGEFVSAFEEKIKNSGLTNRFRIPKLQNKNAETLLQQMFAKSELKEGNSVSRRVEDLNDFDLDLEAM
jgi:hypothetical protein